MAHQNAGDQGKPSIHIGRKDADRATELGLDNESPSTVYSESLEIWQRYREIKKKERKKAKQIIVEQVNRMEEDFDIDRDDLLEDIANGEIV